MFPGIPITAADSPVADQSYNDNNNSYDRNAIRAARSNILRNCKHPTKESAHQAQKKLDELVQVSILEGRQLVALSIYNSCLHAWAKSGLKSGFRKATTLLEAMHQRHEEYPDLFPAPNTVSYHSALDACARSSANQHTEAAQAADTLMRKMEALSASDPTGNVHPETWSYNMVILAHAHQAPVKYGAANDAEDWLRYLSKQSTEGGVGPSSDTFNFVLKAWKASPEDKGADRALELLHLMIRLNREGHHEQVIPCERTFYTVINAFTVRNRPDEAEDVLKQALSFFLDPEFATNYPNKMVDIRACFNIAIHGWAKSTERDAPERADSLLRDMGTLAGETQVLIADPDIYTHTSCMEALAISGRPDAPEIVESRLYGLLEENRENYGNGPLPGPATFDCAIRAWFRSDKENKAQRMESLLTVLIELAQRQNDESMLPRSSTVNLCLNGWCRAGEGKTKAIDLLNRMEIIGRINVSSYIPLIEHLLEESKKHQDSDSAMAAADVLEKLHAQIKNRGAIKWTSGPERFQNEVFVALRKVGTGEAADKAYKLLDLMERATVKRAKPGCLSYSVVIGALANAPTEDRTKKALDIFDHLIQLHHDQTSNRVKADQFAFHAILTCLANTQERWAADRALVIMESMIQMHAESNNDKKLMPNSRCYDKCVQAMARCGDLVSLRDAAAMLERFVADFRDAKAPDLPTEAGFNAVLKYCTMLKGDEAIKIGKEVYALRDELEREGHLITYQNKS